MRRTVVAGLDGSPESLAAADWAAGEAVRRDTALSLLHAVAAHPGVLSFAARPDPGTHPVDTDRTPRDVADDLRREYPELTVTVDQVAGEALPVLLGAADDAELLVLGSHAVGAVSAFVLGSVALAVTGRAPIPVVLVRAAAWHAGVRSPYSDIVLGLDPERTDERVIEYAFEAADRSAAPLRVIHGWNAPLPYGYGSGDVADDVRSERATRETDTLARLLEPWLERHPRAKVVGETVVGSAERHLLDAAAGASLLVIGRGPRTTRLGAHLGPVAEGVLRQATVPVAVVPHD